MYKPYFALGLKKNKNSCLFASLISCCFTLKTINITLTFTMLTYYVLYILDVFMYVY